MHQVYLSLGSNIQPELNIPRAIDLLQEYGEIRQVSNAWESKAVGSDGPNFLNACALLVTAIAEVDLKGKVIHPIEARLGRQRTADKNAPRPIDIDAILFDERSLHDKYWDQAFVIVPLAEIHPEFLHPLTKENITATATRLRQEVWLEVRPGVLTPFHRAQSNP